MAAQIKLYVEPEGEIRRFTLDNAATFATLRQRIQQVVGRDNFRLFWQDAEADFVVLSSDEELKYARESVVKGDGQPLRVFLRPMNKSGSSVGDKKVHDHVTCDGCEGEVAGTRYKCLECPDFDLCEGCEANGKHREHDMVAVRSPANAEWKRLFGHGPRPGHRRGPCGMNRPCGPRRGFGPQGSGCPMGLGPFHGPPGADYSGFIPPFLRPLINSTFEMDIDLDRPFAEVMADFTKKFMEGISQACGEQEDKPKEEEQNPENAPTAQATPTVIMPVVTQVAGSVQLSEKNSAPTEIENGWTELKPEPVEDQPRKMEENKTGADGAPNPEESRIEAALRSMEEMGFPTEGTLMRRLLQNYNGDISRVLDSIK